MFDMGHAMDDRSGDRQPSRTGPFGDVTLPLNDLYLLQKYLIMYEDAWAPGEPDGQQQQQQQQQGQAPGAHSPMARCLAALGPAPPLVQASNNHTTRIPLE
ncbi:hypothetical protein H4R21_000516 [Coemansia helicoidea]|uniref:Uncharacterized protein n=1 Tax=Coemansia helicoidea TaxID=1286919 RepID=A0ACC1LGL8_9FUNG|nr:hypothetical protein H4R21_000516 [Coemansia helicoidea]